MNPKNKTLWGLMTFAAILACAFFVYNALVNSGRIEPMNFIVTETHETAQAPEEPDEQEQLPQAPDFAMLDANGSEINLSEFFGKPIVLNFWTTWCRFCVLEMPYFENLYRDMGDTVHVIKLNVRESRAVVDNFMYTNGHTFPLYFDIEDSGMRAFGVQGFPATFFINADGYVTAMARGALDESSLQQGLDSILP